MTTARLWTLVALGAFHCLHPGMGWLLAVTRVGLAAAGVRTAAMLCAAGVAALIAYDFLGVHALRRRGVTMDRIWALTLVVGGLFVLWSIWWA